MSNSPDTGRTSGGRQIKKNFGIKGREEGGKKEEEEIRGKQFLVI